MTGKNVVSVLQYLFFLGVGFLFLWLGFRKLDLSEVWTDILKADYWWLLFSLLFAIASHVARALRWNLLINSLGYKTKLSSTFFSVMIGYMANTAVPRMGEFARCGVLSRKEKIPFNKLFGTVISERFFDMLVLVLIIFLVVIFQFDLLGDFVYKIFNPLIDKTFTNLTSIIIFSIVLFAFIGLTGYLIWFYKEKIKLLKFYDSIRLFIEGLWNGIKTIIKMQQKWLFIFYTIVIWFFYVVMVYLPFRMLHDTSFLSLIDGTTVMALGSLGIVAPVPGGIGAYHYITKVILTELFSVEANSAMSYATIVHAGQTFLNVIFGSLSYLLIGFYSRKQKPLNEKPGNNT